ncbi:hypothetical protein ANANG_G00183840, partial [Anguilla anguilla]
MSFSSSSSLDMSVASLRSACFFWSSYALILFRIVAHLLFLGGPRSSWFQESLHIDCPLIF